MCRIPIFATCSVSTRAIEMKRESISKRRAIVFFIIPIVLLTYDLFATVRLAFRLPVPLSSPPILSVSDVRELAKRAGRTHHSNTSSQVEFNATLRTNGANNGEPITNLTLKEANALLRHPRVLNARPFQARSTLPPRSEGEAKRKRNGIDYESASKSRAASFSHYTHNQSHNPQPKHGNGLSNRTASSTFTADVLVVVVAIPGGYPAKARVAAASHRAYAARHGYRLVVQKAYLGGDARYHNSSCVSMQKLLACRLSLGEKYLLIIDYDVVIAPWAPRVPSIPAGKIGIVDEAQPSAMHIKRILKLRTGQDTNRPEDYYRSLGFPLSDMRSEGGIPAGILNTGVLLVEPAAHGDMMEKLYVEHVATQLSHASRFHFEQALIGHHLMSRGLVHRMHHAWNRNWVWYNWSGAVGLEEYSMGDVFRRTYFMHFLWAKNEMPKLERWMSMEGIGFEGVGYERKEGLLP